MAAVADLDAKRLANAGSEDVVLLLGVPLGATWGPDHDFGWVDDLSRKELAASHVDVGPREPVPVVERSADAQLSHELAGVHDGPVLNDLAIRYP